MHRALHEIQKTGQNAKDILARDAVPRVPATEPEPERRSDKEIKIADAGQRAVGELQLKELVVPARALLQLLPVDADAVDAVRAERFLGVVVHCF